MGPLHLINSTACLVPSISIIAIPYRKERGVPQWPSDPAERHRTHLLHRLHRGRPRSPSSCSSTSLQKKGAGSEICAPGSRMGPPTGLMGTPQNGVNLYFFTHLPSWIEEREGEGRRRAGPLRWLPCYSAAQAKKMHQLPGNRNKSYTIISVIYPYNLCMIL